MHFLPVEKFNSIEYPPMKRGNTFSVIYIFFKEYTLNFQWKHDLSNRLCLQTYFQKFNIGADLKNIFPEQFLAVSMFSTCNVTTPKMYLKK